MKRSCRRAKSTCAILSGAVLAAPLFAAPDAALAGTGRSEVSVESDGEVEVSEVRLRDPLPATASPHPEACDYLGYVRYRHAGGPKDPLKADSVFVGMPGAATGPYSGDSLGRNTVRAAAAKGKKAEFWWLTRRAGCLNDDTGVKAAFKAGDYRVAIDYYYNRKPVDGKAFEGFKSDRDLPYLANFGLARTLRDQYTVLTRELQDPAFRRTRTFCGGPALAGPQEALFAAWDFDGKPGHDQCAGFFGLDALISTDPVMRKTSPLLKTAGAITQGMSYPEVVKAAHDGVLPRTLGFTGFLTPELFTLLSIIGIAAYHEPDKESELFKRIPPSAQRDFALRAFFARTYPDFATGKNGIDRFRFTNSALLGALVGKHSSNMAAFQVGIGAYTGGPIEPKTFPLPEQVAKVPIVGAFLTAINPSVTRMGPTDPTKLYGWRNYNEVNGVPYTSPARQATDARALARRLGQGGFWEPYFPLRSVLDTAAAIHGVRTADLAGIRHTEKARSKPTLTVLGGDSAIKDQLAAVAPKDAVTIPGYTHADPITAAWKQNDGRPEKVSANLVDFADRHLPPSGGTTPRK